MSTQATMAASPIGEALAVYERAVGMFPTTKADDAPEYVLRALVAREDLARLIAQRRLRFTELRQIAKLDQKLKKKASAIDTLVEHDMLAGWREAAQPTEGAWWWTLETQIKKKPFWTISGVFCVTVSLGLIGEIARRMLSVGPDFLSIVLLLVQSLLTLLAGGALIEAGQKWIERLLTELRMPTAFQPVGKAIIALIVLVLLGGFWLALPVIARWYNDAGVRHQQAGQITSAIEQFERAISLAPNYAQAHYNLANAYERIMTYERAQSEYLQTIAIDTQFYAAYNNLARLNLRHGDSSAALELLNTAIQQAHERQVPADVEYVLLKNRGWAYLQLKLYSLAEADLQQAIAKRSEGAAAYCLLAQVREARQDRENAQSFWSQCVAYQYADVVDVEDTWLAIAREHLERGSTP